MIGYYLLRIPKCKILVIKNILMNLVTNIEAE